MDAIFNENGKQYIGRPVISRDDIILEAVDKCLDAMYRASYPSITLEEYRQKHRDMTEEERKTADLYNAHYLPERIYITIKDDIERAYQFKSDLPEIVEILKGYFKEPIVDAWVKDDDEDTGHRGYEHPDPMPEEHRVVAEKYLDMANDFYNWNRDYNSFIFNVANFSPCCNRETVERWHHEHGEPDFNLPDDDYWRDAWDDDEDETA